MGLKNLFGKKTDEIKPFADQYWNSIEKLSSGHILRLIDFFHQQTETFFDWYQPRFLVLNQPDCLHQVVAKAMDILCMNPNGIIYPEFVGLFKSWYVVLSVFPSATDARFIEACPNSSYEELARQTRAKFREFPQWGEMDFAHWIFLVNPATGEASISLHTIWNIVDTMQFVSKSLENGGKILKTPPIILPTDLMLEDLNEFELQLTREDVVKYYGYQQ